MPGSPRPFSPRAAAAPGGSTGRENQLLRELVAVYSHLSGLASQDADMGGVVRLVAHRTRAAVVVLGPAQQPLAAAPADAAARLEAAIGAAPLAPVLAAAAQNRRPMSLPGLGVEPGTIAVAPIMVNHDVVAHLVSVRTPAPGSGPELDDDLNLLLTEHAATICGIILGRERAVAAAGARARTELVEGLLLARDRDDGEAERWAGHLGFLSGVEHHVFAVAILDSPNSSSPNSSGPNSSGPNGGGPASVGNDPPAPDRSRMLALAERAILRRIPEAIVAVRETEVVAVALVPAGSKVGLDDVRSLAQQCRNAIVERYPDMPVVAGIGGCCRQPVEISRSYAEARRAIDAAARMGTTPAVVAFDDLGIHRLLLQVPDLAELRSFATAVLGDLVRDRGRAELLATLAAWFRTGGSPQRTARVLHLHANTVSYRIRRVEEIAGLRLDDHRDRLLAQVACEIVDVLGPW
jgi:PucR C-terminal helix-turn-helix domain/GGDEF-like domain